METYNYNNVLVWWVIKNYVTTCKFMLLFLVYWIWSIRHCHKMYYFCVIFCSDMNVLLEALQINLQSISLGIRWLQTMNLVVFFRVWTSLNKSVINYKLPENSCSRATKCPLKHFRNLSAVSPKETLQISQSLHRYCTTVPKGCSFQYQKSSMVIIPLDNSWSRATKCQEKYSVDLSVMPLIP